MRTAVKVRKAKLWKNAWIWELSEPYKGCMTRDTYKYVITRYEPREVVLDLLLFTAESCVIPALNTPTGFKPIHKDRIIVPTTSAHTKIIRAIGYEPKNKKGTTK